LFSGVLELGERAESELFGPDQTAWLDMLEAEHDNLREALKGCRQTGEFEAVYRLAASVWRFWWIRGYLGEGRAWLDGAFSDYGLDPVVRAKALHAAGALAWDQSDLRTARDFLVKGMSLFAELGDARGAAFSRLKLGAVFCLQGDYDRAEALMRESLALGRQTDDSQTTAYALIQLAENAMLRAHVWEARSLGDEGLAMFRELGDTYGITASLGILGEAALHEGDHGRAKAMLEESLRMGRAMGDKWRIAMAQAMLGELAGAEKDYRRAAALHKNALGLRWEIGQGEGIAESIEALAALAAHEGKGDCWRAAQLYGATEAVREAVGAPVHPVRRSDHDGQVALLRAGIDEVDFARAWETGRALPLEEAIRLASEAGEGVG